MVGWEWSVIPLTGQLVQDPVQEGLRFFVKMHEIWLSSLHGLTLCPQEDFVWKHIMSAQLGPSTECSLDGGWAQLTVQILWDTVPLPCWAQCLPGVIAVGQASKSICPGASQLHFGFHCLPARQKMFCDIREPCVTAAHDVTMPTRTSIWRLGSPEHHSLSCDQHGTPRQLTC